MPLYEYECKQCKRRTEKIQKFSDVEITECPHCGGPLERVVSAPAISFKGGGWYADGYGNAKPAAKSEGSGSSSASTESAAKPAASAGSDSSSSAPAAGTSAPAATSTPASSSEKK
jgi:putative FmdB family regulatory protein